MEVGGIAIIVRCRLVVWRDEGVGFFWCVVVSFLFFFLEKEGSVWVVCFFCFLVVLLVCRVCCCREGFCRFYVFKVTVKVAVFIEK